MESVRRACGIPNGIDMTSVGSSRGLSLGWKHNVSITLRSFLGCCIDFF